MALQRVEELTLSLLVQLGASLPPATTEDESDRADDNDTAMNESGFVGGTKPKKIEFHLADRRRILSDGYIHLFGFGAKFEEAMFQIVWNPVNFIPQEV